MERKYQLLEAKEITDENKISSKSLLEFIQSENGKQSENMGQLLEM